MLFYTVDFSTFKGSVDEIAKCTQITRDFAKTQTLIQIPGDSDAGGPGITLGIVTSKAALSNMAATHHM